MKISIVIPAFNEEKLLSDTLASVRRAMEVFAELKWESELIICDNNSTDRTADIARAGGAKVVFEPVNQIGRARNTGAAAATGDWLVFIDADSHPSRELLGDAATAIQSGCYIMGGCTVKLDENHFAGNLTVWGWTFISRMMKYAAGSFIFCEAEAFRQVKGFNIQLYASEEIDLSQRLKKLARQRGKKLIILHRHPLVTSARKLHLYSKREYFRFFAKTVWGRGKTLTKREECAPWYDGRR